MADKVEQIKNLVEDFADKIEKGKEELIAKLKEYKVDVKTWNVAVGKEDKGVSLEVAMKIIVTKK